MRFKYAHDVVFMVLSTKAKLTCHCLFVDLFRRRLLLLADNALHAIGRHGEMMWEVRWAKLDVKERAGWRWRYGDGEFVNVLCGGFAGA